MEYSQVFAAARLFCCLLRVADYGPRDIMEELCMNLNVQRDDCSLERV